MNRVLSSALLLLAFAFAPRALASTLSSAYPELRAEIDSRRIALPVEGTRKQRKQKALLAEAQLVMDRNTSEFADKLADAGTVLRAVDAAYPGDSTFDPLLEGLLSDMRQGVINRQLSLQLRVAAFPERTKLRNKLDKTGDRVDGAIEKAAKEGSSRAGRYKAAAKAFKLLGKLEVALDKAATPGGPPVTTSEFDVAVDGQILHLPPPPMEPPPPPGFSVILVPGFPRTLRIAATGDLGDAQHSVEIQIAEPGLGDRALLNISTYNSTATIGGFYFVSGRARITSWLPDSGQVAGTFEAVFTDDQTTVTLSNGSFSTTTLEQ